MWRWTVLGREEGGEGREGSETGGAWLGTGLGREDGGERDGRRMGGEGRGTWVGTGWGGNMGVDGAGAGRQCNHVLVTSISAAQDRSTCTTKFCREAWSSIGPLHASFQLAPSLCRPCPRHTHMHLPSRAAHIHALPVLHHKHHCRLPRVSSQVERSMGGGSSAPCFAEVKHVLTGGELCCRAYMMVLGVQNVHNACARPKRQGCCTPEPQCLKFDGWNKAWRGLMLLHASWNGCQKPRCNGD